MNTIICADEIDNDVEYFKTKLVETTNLDERKKIQRIIEFLQDAVVIYKLSKRDAE
jgi:hypothetical protein